MGDCERMWITGKLLVDMKRERAVLKNNVGLTHITFSLTDFLLCFVCSGLITCQLCLMLNSDSELHTGLIWN